VKDHLHLRLEQDNPQLISPTTFWQASEATHVVIEAAFHTTQKRAVVMWQPLGANGFPSEHTTSFPIVADGEFHRHVIPLAEQKTYQGAMQRLRIDPLDKAEPGAWMRVRSVRLTSEPH